MATFAGAKGLSAKASANGSSGGGSLAEAAAEASRFQNDIPQAKLLSVAMFKIVSETLWPRTESSMPERAQVNLYAFYQQATIGPNVESPPNCLLSFISPPLTNVKWQTWRNLGSMSKPKAMKAFMELYIDNDPDFLSGATINSRIPVDELRVQVVQQIKVLALKRRTDKFLFLYSKIGKAVLKIQTAARTFIAKKAYLLKHSHSMQTEVGWLVDVLKLGIRVTKVAYNGGVPRARFLWLEGDSFSLGSARICVSSKLAKGNAKTKGIYIADIAEIRPSSSSYTFKLSGSKFDDSECLSIIGTERTVDLVFYKGEMYGKSRDWLVRTLNILVDKSMPAKELASRGRISGQRASGVVSRMSAGSLRDAEHMADLLQKGFGVREFIEGSAAMSTVMYVIAIRGTKDSRVVLATGLPSVSCKGINISDLAEVRFGKVSSAHDLDFPARQKIVTLVGSECSIHLLFDDDVLKHKFAVRMQCYLQRTKTMAGL